MSLFSRLFGGGSGPKIEAEPEDYKGFAIYPEPIPEGGQFRVAGRIEKDGRSHKLIRADVLADRDAAVQATLGKARMLIDEQGERLFD